MPLTFRGGESRPAPADIAVRARRSAAGELTDLLMRPASGERVVRRPAAPAVLSSLRMADRAIAATRRRTPDGAGNQLRDLLASDGIAAGRARFARMKGGVSTRAMARGAARAGGGHCAEFASLAFAELAATGASGPVLRGVLGGTDHAFTMIGDPREAGSPVVVDAWAGRPQAHVWADSEWNHPQAYGSFDVLDSWNGGRADPTWDLRAIRRAKFTLAQANKYVGAPSYTRDLPAWLLEQPGADGWIWNQPYATREDAYYVYERA